MYTIILMVLPILKALQSNDKFWANTHQTEGIDVVRKRVLSRGLNPDLLSIYQRNIIDKDSLAEVESICLANLDVDMYEAVLQGLLRIHEKLVLGGVILVEDKGHTPQLVGACVALAEFFEIVGSTKYFSLQLDSGQQLLLRVAK